ncbi:MAG: DUF2288 domain-containing protein [Thermosynechococcaceae cyanobacterium]
MTDIREQLNDELAEIDWQTLMPHSKRDAVIVVHEGLDLIEVGVAIAQDNVSQVQVWIAEQLVQKPTAQQLSEWNNHPTQLFSTLIVQPYVLISLK